MKFKLYYIAIILFIAPNVYAKKSTHVKDFNYLVKWIENNYPGYHVKVTEENRLELKTLENSLREKITEYPDSCGICLRRYASWFKDNHLRVSTVFNNPNKNIQENNNIIMSSANIADIRNSKESIEGLWLGFRGDVAIVKNREANRWDGISINYHGYKPNQIMFTLTKQDDGLFRCRHYKSYMNYKPVNETASVELNGKIIEIHGDSYLVRKSDNQQADKALQYSYCSKHPNGNNTFPIAIALTDNTFYLRAPGFGSETTNRLVKQHWNEITSRPNLIIDIRYNGGGQDKYYHNLSELIYTDSYNSHGVEWYATKDNIKLFEDALKNNEIRNGEDGKRWTRALIKVLKENRGAFVKHPETGRGGVVKYDTVYPYPSKVGIIINEGNASAAEQFLLASKHSSKVTLFGNKNSAGVLDYSNAVPIELPSGNYKLTYPMTRSCRLPEYPIDNIGIKPDVNIPFNKTEQLYDRLDEWVYFVKSYLEVK